MHWPGLLVDLDGLAVRGDVELHAVALAYQGRHAAERSAQFDLPAAGKALMESHDTFETRETRCCALQGAGIIQSVQQIVSEAEEQDWFAPHSPFAGDSNKCLIVSVYVKYSFVALADCPDP